MIDWMLGEDIRKKEEARMTPRFLAGATEGEKEEAWEEDDGFHFEHADLLVPVGDPSGGAWEAVGYSCIIGLV